MFLKEANKLHSVNRLSEDWLFSTGLFVRRISSLLNAAVPPWNLYLPRDHSIAPLQVAWMSPSGC